MEYPTKRQNEVANIIYDKPFNELADFAKNVVNRVVKNFYGEDN